MRSGDEMVGRRRTACALVAVLVAAVGLSQLTAGSATSGADGFDVIESGTLLVRDGDFVVFTAKGTNAGAPSATENGYTLYSDATLLEAYTIRLVESDGIEQVRPILEVATEAIRTEAEQQVEVQPGYVGNRGPGSGEIDVVVSSRSPCTGSWLGCSSPTVSDGKIQASRIWINPRLFDRPAGAVENTVHHELGHALGLGHFDHAWEGRIQTMHSRSFEAHRYESGDLAGIRELAGTPPGATRPSSTEPTAPPPDVDPRGELQTVRPTPVGVVIRGRALDPDTPEPITVVVTMNGSAFELVAGRADEEAGDNHGFEVLWSVVPGTHEVCVTARNVGEGSDQALGCQEVSVSGAGIGHLGLQTL